MEEFGVFGVFGINGPPQKLLRASVAIPASVHQVVLFSSGPWGERICVNAELNDADRFPITIGKLTPYNKCLSWEQWEEETWTNGVTLTITLEGGDLVNAELNKRKRERTSEDADGDSKGAKTGEEEENTCPNGAREKTTPVGKAKGQGKSSKRLFGGRAGASNVNGAGDGSYKEETVHYVFSSVALLISPSARWGQTLCPIDAQTAILIGGQGARMQFCKDPMWKLCTEDMSWMAAETLAEGPTPETRIGHTATFDPDSKRIFVFGGSKNRKWFNDVHILDTQTWRWSMVEAQGKVPPLAYHSCSMFRGELFVLGGVFPRPNPEPDGCSDSLYIFDPQLSIWYQPIVTGDKPSPRSGHSACVIQQRYIYVFGGWDTPVCYNDMYMLDLGLMEFSAVKTTGKAPSPRSWHGSAVLSDTKFLIHGGYNGNNALGDAFIFDIETHSWTEAALPQLSVPRAGHSIIAMETGSLHGFQEEGKSCRKTLLVFGGGDNEGNFYSDLTAVAVKELLDAL
uniref:Kelch repeat-containing protein n=1 Tax=Oryzias latipes TaxID=8090 RepID=A0A3P9HLM1_ORYLA